MLDNLSIVLFGTKFPENVGSSARAMTNMGCENLTLVRPASWDMEKARPLATVKGRDIVEKAVVADDLSEALKGQTPGLWNNSPYRGLAQRSDDSFHRSSVNS